MRRLAAFALELTGRPVFVVPVEPPPFVVPDEPPPFVVPVEPPVTGVVVGPVVGVGVGLVTGVPVAPLPPLPGVAQSDGMIVSSISVTAPLLARSRPFTVTVSLTLIDWSARMVPTNDELVPSVAELPTCQNTLHGWAPLM